MGLIKRNGYEVKGVTLPQAYAKINRLYIEENSNLAKVYFAISNTRENLESGNILDELLYECNIDKDSKLYEQIYTSSKASLFQGWEDDIVEVNTIENGAE